MPWSYRVSLFVLVAAGLVGLPNCMIEVDSMGGAGSGIEAYDEPRDEPRGGVMGGAAEDCQGELLPSCDAGWTGPSCDHACDAGAAGCGFRYYCHADGRVAGVALSRAHLFVVLGADREPLELRDRLEGWIAEHGADLGLADGLTEEVLQLEPADGFEVEQGQLALYRFRQFYPASEAHPRIPVMGEGALLSLQTDPAGAVALAGTVIDPRAWYAHSRWQAPASQASASIRHHASVRTGVAEELIEVEALQLVALPWAEQVAWYGVPTAGSMSMGRVLVSADPKAVGTLELLMFDEGKVYALENTTPITVQTQDVMQDPWVEPVEESVESTLVSGEGLLGSEYGGQVQLGTEEVVVIDMHGNPFGSLYDGASWDLERYMEVGSQFTAGEPEEQFRAQRLYHLVKSGYAVVNQAALGQWDSGLSIHNPTLSSDYSPGTFQPRIIVGYNHAPTGSAGQASWMLPGTEDYVLDGFPESVQWAAPGLQNELVATINAPLGLIDADTLFHEVGHDLDLFLAPGYPDTYAPPSCPGCSPCEEDTSDEANPLTETLAQMLGMWQLARVFPDTPHDTCNLMAHLGGGTTNNQANVHSPGCMSSSDSLGLFIRDDDPACLDPSLCDKPSNHETDVLMGSPHWCDATEGYNTFSILQAWWNMLHGLYCEPPGPMGVSCSPMTVVWPPGCDQGGAGIECATPDEVAGLPLLYAMRSNPTSYEQLFDDMARSVSCNYGAQAYDDFNQALCDHQIRACDEPAPLVCEQCGNGIREGAEQCDGHDLSVDELGNVSTCMSLGYEGGTLLCQGAMDAQPCSYEFSLCSMPEPADTSTSDGSDEQETDGDGPGGVDVDDGCACSSGRAGDRRGLFFPMSLVFLLAARRRRMRTRNRRSALLVMLGMTACTDVQTVSVEADTESAPTSDTDASSGSETGAAPSGWPQDWYGEYHQEVEFDIGQDYAGQYIFFEGFMNMYIHADEVTIERFNNGVDDVPREWTLATEPEDGALRLLPPNGQWDIPYFIGVDDVLLRPGEGCDELVLEIYGHEPPYDPYWSARLFRGTLCVIDPYDDANPNDRWIIDLCPGSLTSCDEG